MASNIADIGAVTVYYQKSGESEWTATAPTNCGTYAVKIDVASGDNNEAVTGLTDSSWMFTITKHTPQLKDFVFSAPQGLTYDGNPKAAQVTSLVSGIGAVTVYYQKSGETSWTTTAPTDCGAYTVKINVAAAENYEGAELQNSGEWKFTITKYKVEVGVSGKEQTYTGSPCKVELLLDDTNLEKLGFTTAELVVTYYKVDENEGKLASATPVTNAVAAGKYLYVISVGSAKEENFKIPCSYTVADTSLPDEGSYSNVGYLLIQSQAIGQKPISFVNGAANMKVGETYTNVLNNENGTTPEYTSSDTATAPVDQSGTVTALTEGSVTITAVSKAAGKTPVYPSYIVNITKIPVTVTAQDTYRIYGEDGTIETTVAYRLRRA